MDYTRHAMSAGYQDLKGRTWERFLENLRAHGVQQNRKVMLYEGQIIDGWQLYRACLLVGIAPEFETLALPEGQTVEEWVEMANDLRRHETQEKAERRREERIKRVADARRNGESQRQIAKREGVSQQQVKEDIKEATEKGFSVEPKDGKIKGEDGRTRMATPKKKPSEPEKPKEEPKPDPVLDEAGVALSDALAAAFSIRGKIAEAMNLYRDLAQLVNEIATLPGGELYRTRMKMTRSGDKERFICTDLDNSKNALKYSEPYAGCPYCHHAGKVCAADRGCRGLSWLPRLAYNSAPEDYRRDYEGSKVS